LLTLVNRGDITGCSFGFIVDSSGVTWSTPKQRSVVDVKELLDVSPTSFPAYSGTSLDVGLAAQRALGWKVGRVGIYDQPVFDEEWAQLKCRLRLARLRDEFSS